MRRMPIGSNLGIRKELVPTIERQHLLSPRNGDEIPLVPGDPGQEGPVVSLEPLAVNVSQNVLGIELRRLTLPTGEQDFEVELRRHRRRAEPSVGRVAPDQRLASKQLKQPPLGQGGDVDRPRQCIRPSHI